MGELIWKPVFADLEFATILLTEEPAEKLNKAVDEALEEAGENWSVDDVIERIEEKVEIVYADRVGGIYL